MQSRVLSQQAFSFPLITKDIKSSFSQALSFNERRNIFLGKLLSPNSKNRYKRYLGAPIRYAGGKSLAVGLIVELIPSDARRVISPFLGGGSVEVAVANELELPVIGYDIFDILVNYWQVQLKTPSELYEKLSNFKPNKREFQKIKERLKQHWKGEKKLDNLDLAAHYYYNHNTSYGPGFLSWPSSVYMQEKKYSSMLKKIKNFEASNLKVFKSSFEKVIPRFTNDFLYCDPPYFLDGDSKMFKGIYPQRNFPIHHNSFNHEALRDLLLQHKGKFILSYNDCSTIREWYKDFTFIAGDAYSVKSGQKRWQIFLYGKNRFETDNAFQSMNGIGQLLIECINLYPDSFTDYQKNKIDVFADNLDVRNSKARNKTQTSDQKVIFKYKDKNLGELEMRNSGFNHYKEVLFVMNKKQVLDLLLNNIKVRGKYKGKILLYGDADKKFIHRKNIF